MGKDNISMEVNRIGNKLRQIRSYSSSMLGKSGEHYNVQSQCDELIEFFDRLENAGYKIVKGEK